MSTMPEVAVAARSARTPLRCAIYTRKSTEESLHQPFNSLEAQRESGEAYVLSQRHAGWTVIAERYDDGGYTGGNLERPALQRLLVDVQAGRIDCVIVYKVDRLSRSLLDFARLMEVFERHGASLVSVTQPLNTTMSLGRLTLNILLSFAQFEREIIAERTRDKIAAAKKKGKWSGGLPVLGYDVAKGGGKLVVHRAEARRVREIFARYLECESIDELLAMAEKRGWRNKPRTSRDAGRLISGPLRREVLLRILKNPVYIGQVRYGGETYAGEHDAIVEETVWQKAQVVLSKERARNAARRQAALDAARRSRTAAPRPEQPERISRIARLLALALKCEQLIEKGEVNGYTKLAALARISQPRMTQILNLRNLAPDIQEQILFLTARESRRRGITERSIRRLSSVLLWKQQRAQWVSLTSPAAEHS
jgi:DNA invertase Pin-like site-specific DNA recombinase